MNIVPAKALITELSLHGLMLGVVISAQLESIVKEVDISPNLPVHESYVNLA